VWLYFFNDDPIAGLRTGSRAFCPNGNCALNPSPSPFAWVVDGDVLAIEFYTGTRYPAQYRNALFFGDHARNCLFVMTAGANGLPDPSTARTFRPSCCAASSV